VPHSHLVIRHLLKQVDLHRARRSSRDPRPEWLQRLVAAAAEALSPLSGIARVGAECQYLDEIWEARLYLGTTEIVGGANDGTSHFANFEADVTKLLALFSPVENVCWTACPATEGGRSYLSLRGRYGDKPVSLKVYSHPPQGTKPALKQRADGLIEAS